MSSPVISLICCPIRERYESFGLGGRYRGPLIPQPVKRRHGKIHKPQNRAPAGRVPSDSIEGQIDMMDFLEVPDSGTGNEKEVKHVHKQEI